MSKPADERRRLQDCIKDLISLLAIPAMWGGQDSAQFVGALLDVVVRMLRLDSAYALLRAQGGAPHTEMVRLALSRHRTVNPRQIGQVLTPWLGDVPHRSPLLVRNPLGEGDVSIVPLRLGLPKGSSRW